MYKLFQFAGPDTISVYKRPKIPKYTLGKYYLTLIVPFVTLLI